MPPKPAPRKRQSTTDDSPKPVGSKKILVRNIPRNCSRQSLELCFESKRKFGRQLSLEENGVQFDEEKREAILCYKKDEDVDQVLETSEDHDITLDNEVLDVQLYEEKGETRKGNERFSVVASSNEYDDEKDDDDENEDDDDHCTVEVTGFKETTTDDTLQFYFLNKKKGGGEIENLTVDREEMKAQIIFKDKAVVENLLKKKHKVDGCTLNVRKFAFSKTEMLLKGLTDDISEETLKYFVGAKLVGDFKLVLNEERTCALVQCTDCIDFDKAVEKCKQRPLEGVYLTPCRVPTTNCIIVTDIPDVTTDTFRYYFESKKSGGGDKEVTEVKMAEDKSYCLIFFEKAEDVQHVCKQKEHRVSETRLSVHPYCTSLGIPASAGNETKFVPPESIDLSGEDPNKLKFLYRNDVQKEKVNTELEKQHAKLSSEPYSLECILTSSVKGCRKLAKSWGENALKILRDYLKNIDVRVKPTDANERKEIIEALQSVSIPDPDKVAVFFNQDSTDIVLVGEKSEVQKVWKQIDKTVTEVENKIKEARAMVEETKNVKQQWKVAYLQKNFIKAIKEMFPDLDITLNEGKAQVHFKGRKEEVSQAEIEMFQLLQSVQESRHKLKEEKIKLLAKEEVKHKINEKFQKEYADCIWKIKDDELLLYVEDSSGRQVSQIFQLIDDFLTKVMIRLDSTKVDILKSKAWKEAEKNLIKKSNGCIEIRWKKKENILEVFTIEDYEKMVSDELDTFFEKNAVYEENFRCDPNKRKYIVMNKEHELKGQPDAKAIVFKDSDILLKGTRAEIKTAKQFLSSLEKKIVSKEEVISKPGVQTYFDCEEGKTRIQQTEKSIPCVIALPDGSKSSGNFQAGRQAKMTFGKPTKCAEAKLGSDLTVEVFGGDMTELKVDVLVNASNNKLEHAGGLAAVIVKKGGKTIQDECTDRVKSKGQLEAGGVFVSKAGHLPCKAVAHALGPVWKGGSHHEEETLQQAVENCLKKTEKKGYKSIAIPALSTGAFHYPVDKACSAIVEKVANQTGLKNIQKVILCDINEGTVKSFVIALQAHAQNVKIHYTFNSLHHGPTWLHTDNTARGQSQGEGRKRSSVPPEHSIQTKIEVIQGELAKQKVDVIVNSTSKSLRLDQGQASKAVFRAAGNKMQDECKENYPEGIGVGDIAVTHGYRLPCKRVYHVAVESYERGKGALKGLWSVVEHCLNEANKHGATSIAFPPIGCGAQKYPVKEAASTMFECISKFLEKTQDTTIKTIQLVIYTEDDDKFEVFLSESRGRRPKSTPSTRRSYTARPKNGQVINISKDSAHFRIDCLDVKISQGDITSQDTDAIVASCNLDLDLSKGAVTRALLKKGGEEIKKDCEKQKATMKKDGIAVTTAGQLKAKYIIHTDTKYKTKEWLHPVELCLKTAEEHGFNSVAFPTLGISVGCSPEGMANVMSEAMSNFTKNNVIKNLREVRIIIFQKDVLSPFIGAMNDAVTGTGIDTSDGSQDQSMPAGRKSYTADEVESSQEVDKISVKIYAEGDSNVDKAFKQLKKGVDDEWMASDLKETILFTMPKHKIEKIKQEGKKHNIQMEIDRDLGEIKLHGLLKNMMPLKDKINAIVRDHEKSKHEHQQAKLLANIVKWYYLKGDKQYPFPDDVNKKIEEAFNKKEAKVQVKDRSGGQYEVDFSSMTEYDVKKPTEKLTVIRRDVVADSAKELPKTWKTMNESQNLMLVNLSQSDSEYQQVLKEFSTSLGRNPNIVKIERIQNQALYTQYAAKRKQMNQQNSHRQDNERILWHGTAADAVTSINHHGFNRSYCGKNGHGQSHGYHGKPYQRQRSSQEIKQDGQPYSTDNKVVIRIYAEGERNVDLAMRQIKKAMSDEWIVDNINDSVILTMPHHKLDQIKKEAKDHSIQIDFDHDLGGIRLQGLVKNMMPVKDKINAVLRAHEHSKHEYQQAKLLANIVRWFYLKDQKQFPFPSNWNKKLEEAFKNKEAKIKVKDRTGGEYEIDFASMTEYDVKNPNDKFPVLRRDIVAESARSQELPNHWVPMKQDENLKMVALNSTDKEYQSVLTEFKSTLGRSPQIISIERLQNQALYTQYAAKRKQMAQQNSHRQDNERVLWHGTAAGPVVSINNHGFNRSYCRGCAYGDGVYFAVNSQYSDGGYSSPDAQGHKRMYRCLVLTGDYCSGAGGMRMPPQKPGQPSHVLYDSVTNTGGSPIMFIVFNDCQAYPEHLITYT